MVNGKKMVKNGKTYKRRFKYRNKNRDRMRKATRDFEMLTRTRSRSPRRFPSNSRRPSPLIRPRNSPVRVLDDRPNKSNRGYSSSLDRSPQRVLERYSPTDLYRESGSAFPPSSYNSHGDNEPQRNFEHNPVFEPPSNLITENELWQQSFGRGSPRANERWERDDAHSVDSQRRDVQNRFIGPDNTWLQDRNFERSTFMENVPGDDSRNMNDGLFVRNNEPSNYVTRNETIQNIVSPEGAHPLVPPFDGISQEINSRQWIQIIDDIGAKENWTYQEKSFQILSKLSGPAREWFLKEQCSFNNWGALKSNFIDAFPPDMEYYLYLQKMLLRRKQPNETYSNYFTVKCTLLKSCNITGRKAVSCLIGGLLKDPLKNPAYKQNFPTIELLYDFLVQNSNSKSNRKYVETNIQMKVDNSGEFFVNQKQFVDVRINGMLLRGYNDMCSEHVTITEEHASRLNLVHNKNKTIIKGYNGKSITSVGDVNALIRVDSVAINMRVHIVPKFLQDVALVIGDSLRNHPDVRYKENALGMPRFLHSFSVIQNTSFSINERLVKKINDERIEPSNPNDSSRFQNNQQSQRSQSSNVFLKPFEAVPARLHNR